ncbi:hypothetical protein QFC19_005156 [Naganishia cerealis]|uniref:Uncharacterized protein n=1 Tax=Naganishia cerealis TaxID=610337 RepID=A0ACC2VQP5_9TREE|nr:hypothetical protein QFC19_005156 [Naganishia cerealis]
MTRATQVVQEGKEVDSDGDEEVDALLKLIHDEHQDSMPKATKAAYRGPMKQYKEWTLEWAVRNRKRLPLDQIPEEDRELEEMNRTLVTGKRVAAFFQERVVGRPHKVRGNGARKGKKVAPASEASTSEAVTGTPGPTVGWKNWNIIYVLFVTCKSNR